MKSPKCSIKLISFPEVNVTYAKDQPEYRLLPCYRRRGAEGQLTCLWKLNLWARLKVLWTGEIWHDVLTFNQFLQPQLLSVHKPEDMSDE